MRLIEVKLPEYGHYWEGNPTALLSNNLVENHLFEGLHGSSRHAGVGGDADGGQGGWKMIDDF